MQWHKRWIGWAVVVSMALPGVLGCEQRQQVRPEVIEPETSEGRLQLRDLEENGEPDEVNIGVRQDEE